MQCTNKYASRKRGVFSTFFELFFGVPVACRLLLFGFHALPDHHNSGTEFSLKAKVTKGPMLNSSISTFPTLLGRMDVNLGSILMARGSQLLVGVLVITQFLKGFGKGYFKPLPPLPSTSVLFVGGSVHMTLLGSWLDLAQSTKTHSQGILRHHLGIRSWAVFC